MFLNEKCGIFGVYGSSDNVARLVYYGLWALQHRGQENSGIASSNGKKIYCHKGHGLVAQVYQESNIEKLKGHIAIGHNRYSTFGKNTIDHSQPVFRDENVLALAHNGNLPQTLKLKRFLKDKGISASGLNDSEMMYRAIRYLLLKGNSLEDAIRIAFPLFTGAFCLLVMTKDKLAAVRDAYGIRPLCVGKLNGHYVFSSETCALDTIGAEYIRDIEPGEMVVASKHGLESFQIEKGISNLDIFELIYFSRPDSMLMGKSVYEVRKALGKQLALETKIPADIVVPVPDSAIPAATGFAEESMLPMEQALIKNRYIHRTFIKPAQSQRTHGVKMKLNLIGSLVKDKRIVLVDDSIVRGTTSKRLVELVRSRGAKEIHMMITSPPVKYPDFYGIDTPDQKDLIAANMSIKEIKDYIGVDSLHYISYEGMLKAVRIDEKNLCTSCFTGKYPIDIGTNSRKIKTL